MPLQVPWSPKLSQWVQPLREEAEAEACYLHSERSAPGRARARYNACGKATLALGALPGDGAAGIGADGEGLGRGAKGALAPPRPAPFSDDFEPPRPPPFSVPLNPVVAGTAVCVGISCADPRPWFRPSWQSMQSDSRDVINDRSKWPGKGHGSPVIKASGSNKRKNVRRGIAYAP